MPAIRSIVLIAPAALCAACATSSKKDAELAELRAQLRDLRHRNEAQANQIKRLEDELVIARASQKADSEEQPWLGDQVPDLTVVKLKPRHQAPPPIPAETEVQEPSDDHLQSLLDQPEEVPAAPDPEVAQAYESALGSLRTGDVAGGVLKLQTFAQEHPRHAQSDNALYFSGVGLMALEDFSGAAAAFSRVLKEYPAGDARLESMLKLADCRVRQDLKEDAKAIYARLIKTYPGTEAAHTAQERLSNLTQ